MSVYRFFLIFFSLNIGIQISHGAGISYLQGVSGPDFICSKDGEVLKENGNYINGKTVILHIVSQENEPWIGDIEVRDSSGNISNTSIDSLNQVNNFLDGETLEINIPKGGSAKISCSRGNLTLYVVGYLGQHNRQEAKFDHNWPRPIETDSPFQPVIDGLGWLTIIDTTTRQEINCNTFRIAKGYWLSNLHCFQANEKYNKFLNKELKVIAKTGKSLTRSIELTISSIGKIELSFSDLELDYDGYGGAIEGKSNNIRDFVVLKESEPFSDGPILQLQSKPIPKQMISLSLWKENESITTRYDSSNNCKEANSNYSSNRLKDCPQPLLRHQCGTQRSTSGSPILDPDTKNVVALHFFSAETTSSGLAELTNANCALPSKLILEYIENNKQE